MFFGAPLVAREVEHGTHRLVWTQGVTRLRWALVKFGLVGASALALAVAYALLVSWWMTPMARATASGFDRLFFDVQGAVPVAYTVFAVALGIFAGTVWRKTLPAMAVTLVGFIGARIAVGMARPHFQPQLERRFPVVTDQKPNRMLGDWLLDYGLYDSEGHYLRRSYRVACPPAATESPASSAPPVPEACGDYAPGTYNLHVYQPAGRFWLFQYIESGLFIALAALLIVLAIYQIRRRIS